MHEKRNIAKNRQAHLHRVAPVLGTPAIDDEPMHEEEPLCQILTEAIWINGLLNRFLELKKQCYETLSKPVRFKELLVEFLTSAQDENSVGYAKQLATAALADADVSLRKHHEKLKKVNQVTEK